MMRAALEKISRRVVFKRHFPLASGGCSIFVTPEAGLRYWRPDFTEVDKPLLEICSEVVQPGSVVWDVGANVGLLSFCAAGLAGPQGKVYAIEPDTFLVTLLRRSALANPDAARVEVLPVAVADHVGLERFTVAKRSRAASHLNGHGSSQAGGIRESQTVVAVTLDWLARQIPPPDVVKIDSEGAEARILSAGRELLGKRRPIVICEVMSENSAAVTRILKEAKYSIFDGKCSRKSRMKLDGAPWDTLAIPD